jgi:fermentation-respiration switch protein FrsA (DUF1100 family)
MSHIFVRSERVIEASPAEVFNALIDYKVKRPRMLPPKYLNYTVKEGGQGDGTVISYRFRAAGRERPYEMTVEETIAGQVLTERDRNSSLVTRWSVLPVDGGQRSKVSVESDWQGGSGARGFFERTFAPLGLRRVYKDALVALALLVQSPTKNQEMLKAPRRSPAARAGIAAMLLGAALILAAGVKYLRTRLAAG